MNRTGGKKERWKRQGEQGAPSVELLEYEVLTNLYFFRPVVPNRIGSNDKSLGSKEVYGK